MDVAWNQVKVSGLPREEKQRLLSEVEILKELDHKNIIKLYHSWIVTEKDEVSVNFITEACAQTLKKYAAKLKTNLDLRAVKSWSRQILRGLDYLHSHDPPIVHRDLKCDNIFVNQNQGEVKIGDLGLAAALDNQRTKSVIGTPEFMAPELYDEDYDERVDIYSFGMCLIELVTHECPYSECTNPAQIYKRVTGGVKPAALEKIIDSDLRSFILKCISPIEKRLTAKELMNDPFLDKSLNKPKVVEKRSTAEEEPEAARPGGTKQFAKVKEKKEDGERDHQAEAEAHRREPRESAAESDGAREAVPAPGSADGGGSERGDHGGSERGAGEAQGSRAGSDAGGEHAPAGSRPGSDAGSKAGSEATSPTAEAQARPPSYQDSLAAESEGAGTSEGGYDGSGDSRKPSRAGSKENLAGEHADVMGANAPGKPKSRLAQSTSRSASVDNLAGLAQEAPKPAEAPAGGDAAEAEGQDRRKGGSLDFRVKGRILEDKTLRLRLKIGDASGHTRTVEFPFDTDTDSSYSVASEMVDELQLAQSDVRTIMKEIENEVKFLNEGKKKKAMEGGAEGTSSAAGIADAAGATDDASSQPRQPGSGYASGDGAASAGGRASIDIRSPPRAGSPAPAHREPSAHHAEPPPPPRRR